MLGLHYSLSARSNAVMAVVWNSPRLYLITILVSGSCCILDVLEESLFSLFGQDLYLRIMLLIKLKGKLDHIDKLPDDLKKYVKSYQGELTQSQKRDVELVVLQTENIKLQKD